MTHAEHHPDITAIVTAHNEGLITAPSVFSALSAIDLAMENNIACELLIVLDRADDLTKSVAISAIGDRGRYIETDEGDPGLARNKGVEAARGRFSSFLDGDDLWSENWLVEAYKLARTRPDAIFHSACNLVFGGNRMLFWHTDSETQFCDPTYLNWNNYWDSMCFARTDLLRRFPNKANDLKIGFGHEDWHWNSVTLASGVPHKPVPGTMHFKRARQGSQMGKVDGIGGFRWPVKLKQEPDGNPVATGMWKRPNTIV